MEEQHNLPENEEIRREKAALHKQMRLRQRELTEAYISEANAVIQDKVLASPRYREANRIFMYLHTPKEPATDRIVARALAEGKAVYVPKCIGKHEMLAVRIYDVTDLEPGAYGIPEPRCCEETITADEADLILTPCLSASPDGKRLGHGAGYYDRFLAGNSEKTVCLCFGKMLCPDIPVTELDVRMSEVITEEQT